MLIKSICIEDALISKQGVFSFSVNPCIYISCTEKKAIKGNMARTASVTLWESINLSSFSLIQVGFRAHLL